MVVLGAGAAGFADCAQQLTEKIQPTRMDLIQIGMAALNRFADIVIKFLPFYKHTRDRASIFRRSEYHPGNWLSRSCAEVLKLKPSKDAARGITASSMLVRVRDGPIDYGFA